MFIDILTNNLFKFYNYNLPNFGFDNFNYFLLRLQLFSVWLFIF